MKLNAYAVKTDQGPLLNINEDGYDIDLVNKLFMIFDGFGGSGIGDKAVGDLKKNLKNFYTRIGGDQESTLPFYYSYKYLLEGNALINAINYAHKILCDQNNKLAMNERAGASGVIACSSENILTLASVGNCEAKLLRRGSLERLTRADDMRLLNEDSFSSHFRNTPLSAFGLFEDIHMDIAELRVAEGDLVILMTDGAYCRLEDDELKYILNQDKSLSDKVNLLFDATNERGNSDNQTAMLLQF